MTDTNDNWARHTLAHVWHPCTQMKDHERLPLVPIASADGAWLTDTDGKRYLDAVSSWWTNLFGHRHPKIVAALKAQLDTLDHVMFAGFTHEPAVRLAEKLCALTKLDKCFFADIGSSAVEVALKMSHHYWRNSGQPKKTKFIALENSYHGETLGALAVGAPGIYRDAYAPLLMDCLRVPSPDCYHRGAGQSWEDYSRSQFMHMRDTLERHAHEVCAVIVEPLVHAAGGMRMYHPVYLKLLRDACDKHGVHLIADEIAVGFGRTGKMFASEWANGPRSASTARGGPERPAKDGRAGASQEHNRLAKDGGSGLTDECIPDFMCLSKGLTGGTLPLAAVLTKESIYQAFYADYSAQKAFLHSHSYTGNPLACRAALATLDIFAERDWLSSNRNLGHLMWMGVSDLLSHPHVAEVRQQGMIVAIELVKNATQKTPFAPEERRGRRVYEYALSKGVVLRPLGDVIYFMPPYTVNAEEIGLMCRTAVEGIAKACDA